MFDAKIFGSRASLSAGLVSILFTAGVALTAGCTDNARSPAPHASSEISSPAPAADATAGSIEVALVVPPNVQISTFTYQITRGTFSQSGSIDVSHAGTVTGVIGGLAAATGYQVTLSASDPSGKLTGCSGSATFDVTAGTETSVPIAITCHLAPAATPAVPVPFPAAVALAIALMGAGMVVTGRSRRSR